MTPLYRFLASRAGPRLAPLMLAAAYATVLLAIVLLVGARDSGHILYLDMP